MIDINVALSWDVPVFLTKIRGRTLIIVGNPKLVHYSCSSYRPWRPGGDTDFSTLSTTDTQAGYYHCSSTRIFLNGLLRR